MHNKKRCRGSHFFGDNKGPSSFSMQDPKLIFDELDLKPGQAFLDMGCGTGDYTIQASKMIGASGMVYALDMWEDLVTNLAEKADSNGLKNIKAMVADITDVLPIDDRSIDICFIATVLHGIELHKNKENLFSEINRVLKPKGRLSIVNCKKEEQPFGPPLHMRLSPEEMESIALEYGFEKINLVDLGYNYMIQFGVK